MGLLGNSWDDPQSAAMMALSAGLLQRNLGAGLLGANNAYAQAKNDGLKQQYVKSQIDNYASEIESRKASLAKQQQINDLLTGAFGQQKPPSAMPGQLGSGSFGAMPPPQGMPGIPQAPQGIQGGQGGSRIGSMPLDTLALLKAQGLDLVDVAKLGRPDMQVSNGYAYDKNNTPTGFLPFLKASENGQVTVGTPGPDGMPRISAPPGALDTYSAFRGADEAAKSGQDLVKVVGADGAERYITRAQAVQATQPPRPMAPQPPIQPPPQVRPQPGMTGSYTGSPDQVQVAIAAIRDPQERANAQAAFEEQARRTPNFSQGGFQASQTTSQITQAAADKEQAVQTVKDVAEQRKGIMNAGFVAPSNIAKYQQIGKLLADVDGGKYTPMGTEFASALNGFGLKIDKSLPNKQAAMALANEAALQLRSPAGGAGMPGAMSDQDRVFLASMTPNIAQSAEGRKMVIDSYVAVQQRNAQVADFARKYEKKHGKLDNGFFDQLSAWSSANNLFKAQ